MKLRRLQERGWASGSKNKAIVFPITPSQLDMTKMIIKKEEKFYSTCNKKSGNYKELSTMFESPRYWYSLLEAL